MYKILVVEDDRKIALSLGLRLKKAGYQILHSYDGLMGITIASREAPDLILLDISMPAGDGLSVARRLRELPKTMQLPIVFITARKDPGLRERALALGAADYFEKPYDPRKLLRRIRSILEGEDMPSQDEDREARPQTRHPAHPVEQARQGAHQGSRGKERNRDLRRSFRAWQSQEPAAKPVREQEPTADVPQFEWRLPSIAPVMHLILETIDSPSSEILDISNALSRDPASVSRMLAIANSSHYAPATAVTSVNRAVMTLGLSTVKSLVVAINVLNQYQHLMESQVLDLTDLWESWWRCGIAARTLGRLSDSLTGTHHDELFTIGLLHDMGHLALIDKDPERYVEARRRALEGRCSELQAERALFGTTHTALADRICEAWNLPQELRFVAAHHHDESPPEKYRELVKLMERAEFLAEHLTEESLIPRLVDFLTQEDGDSDLPTWKLETTLRAMWFEFEEAGHVSFLEPAASLT